MDSKRPLFILALAFVLAGCVGSGRERGVPGATAQEVRAAKLLDEGRVDEAQAVFLQAAQLNPRPFIASIGVARCATVKGNWNMVRFYSYNNRPGSNTRRMAGTKHILASRFLY